MNIRYIQILSLKRTGTCMEHSHVDAENPLFSTDFTFWNVWNAFFRNIDINI